jgi:hypothetical protein
MIGRLHIFSAMGRSLLSFVVPCAIPIAMGIANDSYRDSLFLECCLNHTLEHLALIQYCDAR